MLFQTFVQLHILLAATPALAGWVLLVPSAQTLPAHVIYLVAQTSAESAVVRGAAEQTPARTRLPVPRQAPCRRFASPEPVRHLSVIAAMEAPASTLFTGFNPFPHAPRAP